jgi:hypothetical protein
MFISVTGMDKVALEDRGNLRSFKVVVRNSELALDEVRTTLAHIAWVQHHDIAWVLESALRDWPGLKDDQAWQATLSRMIEQARPHGWIDDVNRRIKAHVEWAR